MTSFVCERCGDRFELNVSGHVPGWAPKLCPRCYREGGASRGRTVRASATGPRRVERRRDGSTVELLTVDEVVARYTDGPADGVFTDGSAQPNPGPGGWGAVYVVDGEIVAQDHGHEPWTTNNRMELTALLRGADLVPEGRPTTLYTDSKLCFDTITKWAPGWAAQGWKRKRGEVSNLDLVQALYAVMQRRSELQLAWVPAHSGLKWNEYADALSTAYLRERL